MIPKHSEIWSLTSVLTAEEETHALALGLAETLNAGDVVLLSGEIGAGKSFFARAIIRALLGDHNAQEDIPSPTFTLVQTYATNLFEIWHSDLYRLTSVDEVAELGLLDAFETAVCLVEWPDLLGVDTPINALSLRFETQASPQHRRLTFAASDARWVSVKNYLLSRGFQPVPKDR